MYADHYSTEEAVKIEVTNARGRGAIAISLFIGRFSNHLQWQLAPLYVRMKYVATHCSLLLR